MQLYNKTRTSPPRGFISLERRNNDKSTIRNFVFFDLDKKEEKLIPVRLPEKDSCLGIGFTLYGGQHSSMKIEHSFNNMLLISFGSSYFVYNLVTASWLYMGQRLRYPLDSDASLAYDPILLKYKMVTYSNREFHILFDNKCRYVLVPDDLKDFEMDRYGRPVSVDFCLHWIFRKREISNEDNGDSGEICRLDISEGKVSTIKVPIRSVCYSSVHEYRGLLEMGGLLWFFHRSASDYNRVQLWYLKKKKKNGNRGYEDDEWVMMCNINLIAEISAKSRSSPVLLKYWINYPSLLVMDPKCEIMFTYINPEDKHMCVCSYDIELNQWNLIYARKDMYERIHYWHGNNAALSA
ncbi:hypothetical protein MKW94_026895 [Papaver nudicaule]|uniref:Uncharacterized protein n=1 Tax=Papaver nudicaule TaxID=74823 RepID=A0AA42ARG5_PAPNU|nr:hypothetical protein [Papaver nudicaule]